MFFCHFFTKGDTLNDFLFALLVGEALPKRLLLLKEKNVLLEEQILSFKSLPPLRKAAEMKTEELLPLKV